MNWKTWAPLVLAMVLAVAAAKAVHDWMLKNKAAAVPAGNFSKLVVTKADIQPGHALAPEDLTLAQIETTGAPATGFKTVEELAGRVSETIMVKGQPVVEAMLAPQGSGSGLQALVPPGMRAITMEVNEFSGVAGLLTPGCHVDVLATINGGENGTQLAKTIVQNVKVTAVGQRTAANGATLAEAPPQPNEMFKSVTVLCSLADAEAIELACSTGRPRLVLRGGRDSDIVASAGISLGELRGGPSITGEPQVAIAPPTTAPAPATQPGMDATARSEPPHRTVKIIRGGQESTVTLNVLEGSPDGTVTDTKDPFDAH